MAEIEFKRRGTPLWLVLLILLLVGAVAYFAFGRGRDAATVAATPNPAPTAAATPAPGATGATPPAATGGASAEFARFVDAGAFPAAAAAQRTYLTDATRKMADVLQERAPSSGVQTVMLRAIADTLAMPDTKPARIADLTQLAMFAFAHALTGAKVDDGRLAPAAGAVQPAVPLTAQTRQVNDYMKAARDLLRDGAAGGAAAPGAPASVTPPRS
jgi:hypothetical protein